MGSAVAVTGLGAVCGAGWGVPALWHALESGERSIRRLDLFDPAAYRTQIAAQVPAGPALPRRGTRADLFAVHAAREAVRQADLRPDELRGDVGVFFGSSTGGMFEAESYYAAVRERPRATARFASLAHQQNSAPAEAVVRELETHGPVETVASACAAGAMALESALDAVRSGEVEFAIAGGADGLCRLTYAGFNSLRAVDPEPCRPFRAGRAGLSLGEGAGVLVLEPLERVRARRGRVLALLAGAASSCDAHHMTAPHPEGAGAASATAAALADAGIAPDEVDFVDAHGTGTPHNDPAEAAALAAILGRRLPVTSNKAVFGHLLGASGALEAVATVLSLVEGAVPPTPGPVECDPALDVDLVTGSARRPDRCRTALSLSLAFGGANAALLFTDGGEAA